MPPLKNSLVKCLLISQVFYINSICAIAEEGLKINTDLTARIVDASADVAGGENKLKQQNVVEKQEKSFNNATSINDAAADTHICTREEIYVEQLKLPSMQPVRIRTATWCLEFPPRCSQYRTEMREIVKVKNETKTRTIRFCCAGYEGNISINDTICKPVCRGGCGRGYCQTPDVCSCEAGYAGKHCTQRCDHDHWGVECKNECQCKNGAVCDNKSGICHCTSGWTGEFCEQHCPAGTHGVMCRKACECSNKLCHPQTGLCEPNANMIETLNSTIVNITNNLDRIAKNIVSINPAAAAAAGGGATSAELTTVKPMPEVIVIKQDEQHNPKIIVHQSGAGLLDDLHASTGAKTPEVIHVITGATNEQKLSLAGFAGSMHEVAVTQSTASSTANSNVTASSGEHDNSVLTTILIILLVIVIAIALSFLYLYRRFHDQKARVEAALAIRSTSSGSNVDVILDDKLTSKNYLKPLPDLPAFTQMVRNKIEGPEFYDAPNSNRSTAPKATSYDYARKESLYSVISPKSRKGSPDSHLYDEIRYAMGYHGHHFLHPHSHLEQQQQQARLDYITASHYQIPPPAQHQLQLQQEQPPSTFSNHITHLLIPQQNSQYVQEPHMSATAAASSHQIAHM